MLIRSVWTAKSWQGRGSLFAPREPDKNSEDSPAQCGHIGVPLEGERCSSDCCRTTVLITALSRSDDTARNELDLTGTRAEPAAKITARWSQTREMTEANGANHLALVVFEESQEEILKHVCTAIGFGRPSRQGAEHGWHDTTDLHSRLIHNSSKKRVERWGRKSAAAKLLQRRQNPQSGRQNVHVYRSQAVIGTTISALSHESLNDAETREC